MRCQIRFTGFADPRLNPTRLISGPDTQVAEKPVSDELRLSASVEMHTIDGDLRPRLMPVMAKSLTRQRVR